MFKTLNLIKFKHLFTNYTYATSSTHTKSLIKSVVVKLQENHSWMKHTDSRWLQLQIRLLTCPECECESTHMKTCQVSQHVSDVNLNLCSSMPRPLFPLMSNLQQPMGIIFLLILIKCNREKRVNPECVKLLKSISDAQWLYCFMFRCKDVSRMSWTGRWVTAALLNSPTEAVCPIWRPPLGSYYGFAPWHLYSSPTWLSVTPGTAMLTEFTHLIKPCWHTAEVTADCIDLLKWHTSVKSDQAVY